MGDSQIIQKSLLSQKDKDRLKWVREKLAKGENPYESVDLSKGVGIHNPKEKFVREQSEEEVKKLEAKWKAGVDGKVKRMNDFPDDDLYLNPADPDLQDLMVPELDPSKTYCTFCGVEVNPMEATIGKTQPRKVWKVGVEIIGGEPKIEEKMLHVSRTQIACPDCCLHIKPHLDKEGRFLRSAVRFPETEG